LTYVPIRDPAATLIFFNVAAGFLTNLLGWALPAYLSVKAIESPGHEDDVQWLTYWVVFGSFTFLESFATLIVAWYAPVSTWRDPTLPGPLFPTDLAVFPQFPLRLRFQDGF
ncbi:hypothetical protein JCM8097_007603, partial [Rhodosporidiobolus ruineniae]